VYPLDGSVCISAPLGATQESIRQFAASKIRWIEKQRAKFRQNMQINGRSGDRALKNPDVKNVTLCIWGNACNLELSEKTGRCKITLEGQTVKLRVPPGTAKSKKQQILDKWYRRLVQEAAPPLIRKWEPVIGVRINKIFYRKMKSHWGSCNYRRQTIRINTELAKKSPVCLEYVIVHEMLHIIESGHNQHFYRHMNSYVPNWKIIRKKMNSGEL
jgi:predicted metal-dependent hydrolase